MPPDLPVNTLWLWALFDTNGCLLEVRSDSASLRERIEPGDTVVLIAAIPTPTMPTKEA